MSLGYSSVGRATDRHAGSIPRCGKGFFFLPESTFSADSLYGVHTPPCAITCIYICAHVKDPVVHVRVRWIMETLNYPACTVAWVARPCRSWLSPAKETRISQRAGNEESHWDNTVVKSKSKKKVKSVSMRAVHKKARQPLTIL